MAYTLGEAARAIGKSKTAIQKAIASNKLSSTKDAFGRWQIDPAELERVYPNQKPKENDREPTVDTNEIERLKATVEGLERLCRQIENERDSLRERLDRSEDERRDKDRQLTALLSDQREQTARAKRRWWSFGKRA
jgi:chromosome segregation ATPase